jgi:putative CocE/NonD family hydrolase
MAKQMPNSVSAELVPPRKCAHLRGARGASWLALVALLISRVAGGQQLRLPNAATSSDSALAAVLPTLAQQVIGTYADTERDAYLDNLFRLQIVAGQFDAADSTATKLQTERRRRNAVQSAVATLPYQVYAQAAAATIAQHRSFDDGFRESFGKVVGALDDRTAGYEASWAFGTYLPRLQSNWRQAADRYKGRTEITTPDAIDLIRRYLALAAYTKMLPLVAAAEDSDDARRYDIDRDVLVRTPDGASICVLVMRPRHRQGRLPALLNFSIYANHDHAEEARLSASRGYVGVGALTRGKACSPDAPIPFEHDGADAAAVIDWIARQPWSDGRVGMFGGSYDGFAQWAAAKHRPKALKAIMASVTADPGLSFPMEHGVFLNYAYPYPFYVTNVKGLDDATYYDDKRWDRLNHDWYVSGRAYRALDSIDGTPNPIFKRWLAHPSYDAYWQRMMPYKSEFAQIDIPVLTTTGYYDSGQRGALYFFEQHFAQRPSADHYLVIGPYDHVRGQRGTISPLGARMPTLRQYRLDSIAQIEIPGGLRYEWFDYVFKGGPKPALLGNRVNYEVMGANVWKHAASIAAMVPQKVQFHLTAEPSGKGYRLSERMPTTAATILQTVDFADRSDVERMSSGDLIDQALDNWNIIDNATHIANSIEFVSEPFPTPRELSGEFSGTLDFVTNKKDFDFSVTLFELTPKGEYVQLSYTWSRASYVKDLSHWRLLSPGQPQRLAFTSGRLTSRQFQPGSRLVVVLGIIKQSGEQINYGTGKDVSSETIADAKVPLRIQWANSSVIAVPIDR